VAFAFGDDALAGKVTGFKLYDGDKLLAMVGPKQTAFPAQTLAPGLHPLYVQADLNDGNVFLSSPVAVFSVRHTCGAKLPAQVTDWPGRCWHADGTSTTLTK
jgi:hypothetical protein